MINPAIASICAEKGVTIIDGHAYPEIGETRAVATMTRIYEKYGEAHFRLVMSTVAETANNLNCLEAAFFWAVSDLVLDCGAMIERDASRWLSVFDNAPVDQMLWILRGKKEQRHMLRGMLFERIRAAFEDQRDLFKERAA